MKIGSLFSGYGGLDLAAEQFYGATTSWHCEHDEAPASILRHRWPGVTNHRDVTQIDWATVAPVDIVTGGYPCQPFSNSGHRKGTDDERHLWPYVLAAVRQLRPRIVLLENVSGHRSMGFGAVLGDLATDGWDVRWHSLKASDIGAPHHRERVFIMATDPGTADTQNHRHQRPGPARDRWARPADGDSGTDPFDWGRYAASIRRWEHLTGCPAPPPTDTAGRLAPAFAEWMMGLPPGWVTDVPGLTRAHQLKAIGNGICPPQALAALDQLTSMQLPERIDR